MKSLRALVVAALIGPLACGASTAPSELSPAAVGWGNLVVPGLGATLRGEPVRGLIEAGVEIGLFYGGTFGVREGGFTIDSTILLPQQGSLYAPLLGQTMQEFGLKIHMWNTFYHYQQASLAMEALGKGKDKQQPLYKGSWSDLLTAPFRWKNLSDPWVYLFLLPVAAYLFYDYKTNPPAPYSYRSTGTEDALYGFYDIAAEPLGSAWGEEALFRGFIQREFTSYTSSAVLGILLQSALFTLLHPADTKPFALGGGLYFGFLASHFDGDLERAAAVHFWVDLISGVFTYMKFLNSQGKPTLFNSGGPPVIGVKLGFVL